MVRSPNVTNNKFLQELLAKDMCNSLLIYRNSIDKIRLYAFIAPLSDLLRMRYFINQQRQFETLINQYEDTFSAIFGLSKFCSLRSPLFSAKLSKAFFSDVNYNNQEILCSKLTSRELECISMLKYGATDKDMVRLFDVSPSTVEFHLANIRKKLNLHSRLEIIEFAKKSINLMVKLGERSLSV